MSTAFVIHCAVTWALVGLIWIVQLVQYPLFRLVGRDAFRAYHAAHMRQITWIVAPLMLAEIGTAAWLVSMGERDILLLVSFAPLLFNWLSTWRVQIPLHDRLARGFEDDDWRQLVRSNWYRTAAWTARGVLVAVVLSGR